jgi:hypothetical protein
MELELGEGVICDGAGANDDELTGNSVNAAAAVKRISCEVRGISH